MTDTPAPKPTTALAPEEFKVLSINGLAQLQNWLAAIPAHVESGAAGITADQLDLVDKHLNRCRMFLRSWSLTKLEGLPQQGAPATQAQPEAPQANGAAPRKGGWPKGKKRTPRAPAVEGAQ